MLMNSQIAFEELPHKGVHAPLWLTVFLLWGASPPFIALAKAMKAGYGVHNADETQGDKGTKSYLWRAIPRLNKGIISSEYEWRDSRHHP